MGYPYLTLVLGALLIISVFVLWRSLARRGADQSRAYVSSIISDLNPNPVVEVAKEGRITYMNEAAKRLFPDLPALVFAHPCLHGLENMTDRFSRDCHAEGRWYHQDAIVDPSQPGLMRLYVFDITDRKSAEMKQRESANILRNFLEGSSDIIFVKDRALRTVLCNTVFADTIGKRPEDIYGMTDQEMG
jgi:PAS domain-containing protein